ncbi:hypothetical protein PP707_00815 [Acetobacter pasteurianus]|nr:hypothetical protein [Acetobacter pasteurianus]
MMDCKVNKGEALMAGLNAMVLTKKSQSRSQRERERKKESER